MSFALSDFMSKRWMAAPLAIWGKLPTQACAGTRLAGLGWQRLEPTACIAGRQTSAARRPR